LATPPAWLRRYRRQEEQELQAAEDEAAAAAAAGLVDLHNQEFCVDVSTYGQVKFEPTIREKCDTSFSKRCETKTDQVRNAQLTPFLLEKKGAFQLKPIMEGIMCGRDLLTKGGEGEVRLQFERLDNWPSKEGEFFFPFILAWHPLKKRVLISSSSKDISWLGAKNRALSMRLL